MFLLAFLSLLLFIVPYTAFFTGIKFFLHFRIVNKFRPLIDAFIAPYKDKYSYWFGVRLCVLVVSYIVFASFRDRPHPNFLFQIIMLLCFTITQAVIMPYKNNLLNIMELFYLTDSIIVYCMNLFTTDSLTLLITTNIIMAPAVLLFLATVAYHIYAFILKDRCLSRKPRKYEVTSEAASEEVETEGEKTSLSNSINPVSPRATYSAIIVDNPYAMKHYLPGELREPLIESDADD